MLGLESNGSTCHGLIDAMLTSEFGSYEDVHAAIGGAIENFGLHAEGGAPGTPHAGLGCTFYLSGGAHGENGGGPIPNYAEVHAGSGPTHASEPTCIAKSADDARMRVCACAAPGSVT